MVINLGEQNSIFNQFLSQIRDQEIQKDSMRFRRNMERLGELFAYEISKKLEYIDKDITSPLGISHMKVLKQFPVIATILRAGLPLHQGLFNYFDASECAFISAYRRHHKNGKFDIQLEYASSPLIDDKVLIIADPMLASGASMTVAYKELLQFGKPKHTHLVVAIASVEGIKYVERILGTKNITIWAGAIDDEMTAQSYIVPGLGDAGDLAFGSKLELD